MDTTPQNTEVSDAAVEDRLAALLNDDDEPEQEAEQATPEADEEADEQEATEDSEASSEDDSEEVEFEGKSYKVPKELKPALLRTDDYTRKTQEVAAQRKAIEDKAQFLQAREHVMATAAQDMADLRAAEVELEKFRNADWVAIANADPGQAFALSQRQKVLEQTVSDKRARLNAVAQQAAQMQQQHAQKQWQMAVEGAKAAMGKVTAEDDAAALKLVRDLGFTEADMIKLADSRILQAVFDAARWRALQAAKPGVNKKASDAKPMKAVSRSAPQAQRDGKAAIARQTLKKTGDSHAAEAFFESMFRKR